MRPPEICLTYANFTPSVNGTNIDKPDALEVDMKTAALFINGRSQAVRIPKEFEFQGVSEVEITREGDALILRPARKTWTSFTDVPLADSDFLGDREDVIDEGRVVL